LHCPDSIFIRSKALGKVIRAMGVKELAEKIGMESPNLLRAINPQHNPKQATINRASLNHLV